MVRTWLAFIIIFFIPIWTPAPPVPSNQYSLPLENSSGLTNPVKEPVVKVSTARVALLDYELLRMDFPELRAMTDGQVDQWILDQVAYVSINQARQTSVNSQINIGNPINPLPATRTSINDALRNESLGLAGGKTTLQTLVPSIKFREALRPQYYGRALVYEVGNGRLIDVKGTGVDVNRTPQNASFGHSNGLATLGECLREFAVEKMVNEALISDNQRPKTGWNSRTTTTVGHYGVIDLGFSVKNEDGSLDPAGLILRQAHAREYVGQNGNSWLPDIESFDIEVQLRRHGITSAGMGFSDDRVETMNVQGTKVTPDNERGILDFGAFLLVEKFTRPIVSMATREARVKPNDARYVGKPDPAISVPPETHDPIDDERGLDPKTDRLWRESHEIGGQFVRGQASRHQIYEKMRGWILPFRQKLGLPDVYAYTGFDATNRNALQRLRALNDPFLYEKALGAFSYKMSDPISEAGRIGDEIAKLPIEKFRTFAVGWAKNGNVYQIHALERAFANPGFATDPNLGLQILDEVARRPSEKIWFDNDFYYNFARRVIDSAPDNVAKELIKKMAETIPTEFSYVAENRLRHENRFSDLPNRQRLINGSYISDRSARQVFFRDNIPWIDDVPDLIKSGHWTDVERFANWFGNYDNKLFDIFDAGEGRYGYRITPVLEALRAATPSALTRRIIHKFSNGNYVLRTRLAESFFNPTTAAQYPDAFRNLVGKGTRDIPSILFGSKGPEYYLIQNVFSKSESAPLFEEFKILIASVTEAYKLDSIKLEMEATSWFQNHPSSAAIYDALKIDDVTIRRQALDRIPKPAESALSKLTQTKLTSGLASIKSQVAGLLLVAGIGLSTISTVVGAPNMTRVNVSMGPNDLQMVTMQDATGDSLFGSKVKWSVRPASANYVPSGPLTAQVNVPTTALQVDPKNPGLTFVDSPTLVRALENGNPQLKLTFSQDNPLPAAVTAINLQNAFGVVPQAGSVTYNISRGLRDALKAPLTFDNPTGYLFTEPAFQQRLIPIVQEQRLSMVSSYGGNRDTVDATILQYDTTGNLETLRLGYVPLTTVSAAMVGASAVAMLGLSSAGSSTGQKLLNFGSTSGASTRTPTFLGFRGSGGQQAASSFVESAFNFSIGDYNLRYLSGTAQNGAAFSGGQLSIGGLQVTAMTVGAPNGIGSASNPSGTSATLFAVKQGDFEYLASGKQFLPTMAAGLANMPLEQPIGRMLGVSASKVRVGLGTASFLVNTLGTPAMMGAYDRAVTSLVDDPTGGAMNDALLIGAGAGLWEGVKSFNPFTVHGFVNDAGFASMIALDSVSKVTGTAMGLVLAPVIIADAAGSVYQMNQSMGNSLNEQLNSRWIENLRGRPDQLAKVEGIIARTGYDPFNPNDPYVKAYMDSDLSWGESLGKFLVDRNATPSQIAESVVDIGLSFYMDQKYGVNMTQEEWVDFKSSQMGWLTVEEAQVYESMQSEKVLASITHQSAMMGGDLNELKDHLGIQAPKGGSGMFDFGGQRESLPEEPSTPVAKIAAPTLSLSDPIVSQLQYMMSAPGMSYDLSATSASRTIVSNLDRTLAALSMNPIPAGSWGLSYDQPLPSQTFNNFSSNFMTDPLFTSADTSIWTAQSMSLDPFSSSFFYGGSNYGIASTQSGLVSVSWSNPVTSSFFGDFGMSYNTSGALNSELSSFDSNMTTLGVCLFPPCF